LVAGTQSQSPCPHAPRRPSLPQRLPTDRVCRLLSWFHNQSERRLNSHPASGDPIIRTQNRSSCKPNWLAWNCAPTGMGRPKRTHGHPGLNSARPVVSGFVASTARRLRRPDHSQDPSADRDGQSAPLMRHFGKVIRQRRDCAGRISVRRGSIFGSNRGTRTFATGRGRTF
jgi:hypothetical protein